MKKSFLQDIFGVWHRHLGLVIALVVLAAALGSGMAFAFAEESAAISQERIDALIAEWKAAYAGEIGWETPRLEVDAPGLEGMPGYERIPPIQPEETSKEEALALAMETICEFRGISDIEYFRRLKPGFSFDPVYRIWNISLLPLDSRTNPEWSYWVSIEAKTGELYNYQQREPMVANGLNPGDLTPEPISEFSVDIDLGGRGVTFLPDGSIVLIGNEGTRKSTDGSKAAIAVCLNAQGEELWRYEENTPSTDNLFTDVFVLGNGNILINHLLTHLEDYSMQKFVLQIREGKLVSKTEQEVSSGMTGVNGSVIVASSDRSIITDADVIHYPRLDMYSLSYEQLWSKVYDVPFWGIEFISLPDGFYLFGAVTDRSVIPAASRGYAAKMSLDGNIEWSQSFPISSSRYEDAVLQDDGGILVIGGVYEAADGSTPAVGCAASYSPNGEIRFERTYNEFTNNTLDAVARTKNGYLVASAHRYGEQYAVMGLLNENGELTANWEELLGQAFFPRNITLHNTSIGTYLVSTVEQIFDDEMKFVSDIRHFQTIVRRIE